MLQLQVSDWHIECDPDATRVAYTSLMTGTGCSCDQCRNFEAAAGDTFPGEFSAIADAMGFDPSKPAELCHWCREPSGLYLTSGWFHFIGRIIEGLDAMEYKNGSGHLRYGVLVAGIEVGFTHNLALVPSTFAGHQVCQLEFQTRVPWVLTDVSPAP